MPSDESKGSQLDAIGSLAQRQLDNTLESIRWSRGQRIQKVGSSRFAKTSRTRRLSWKTTPSIRARS